MASDVRYTYAVARIRAKEVSLFNKGVIEQLMALKTEEQCLKFLREKGWGDSDGPLEAESMLEREHEKTWELMGELLDDMSIFDVLSYPDLFQNLKAAVKEGVRETNIPGIFVPGTAIAGEEMLKSIKEKEFGKLPDSMAQVAQEAYETLLHTKDGQLCDVLIDKAALEAIYEAGKKATDGIIRNYAESTVAVADIKIAVRSAKTNKTMEFMRKAMVPCESLDIKALSKAAMGGMDEVSEYLLGTVYSGGAEALMESPSAFECWCDNQIIETIRPEIRNPFSAGPLVAYVLARENEIKTVRIILTGKLNGLKDEAIRERIREMYV